MVFCGPNHHGSGSAHAEVSAGTDQHSHEGDALAGHVLGTHVTAGAGSTDEATAMAKAGQVAKQKCSACASCCSLGAILTAVPGIPAADSAPTVFITVVPTVDAFAADGPDRPPRTVLV